MPDTPQVQRAQHVRYGSMAELVTPYGELIVIRCMLPGSPGEHPDVPTGMLCPQHPRTMYLCTDRQALWCDGYSREGDVFDPHTVEFTKTCDSDC